MERSEDLCCKFNIFDYLPSKNSFLGLFCSNTHKMFFFAKMLSFHISGICCFRPGGKVAESKSSERLYFSASWGMLATDPVNVGWVRAILTMPMGRRSGIKEERKKKWGTFVAQKWHYGVCLLTLTPSNPLSVGKGISNDCFEMTQKMFFTTIKSIF